MAKHPSDFTITDLSGGMNDTDPPIAVPMDQCIEAVNVEFVRSMLGERRAGAATVTITGSGLEDRTHLSFLHRHLPSSDETAAELWAFSVTPGSSSRLARKTTAWSTVSPDDAITISGTYGFKLNAQSLHGKLFLAYKSAVDRLHVWDGASLRRAGLAAPSAAPTGANDGGAGTFSGTRYYRVREKYVSGDTTLRSEPSAVLTFSPNGNDTGVVVTKPATTNTSPASNFWELEASLDNTNFYRIATTAIGTTTVTDTTAYATGYAVSGTLSEDSGDYTPPISCKYLGADEDRLLMFGSHEQAALGSRFSWTPVFGDPGVGNDERVPIDTNNFVDLDTYEGGESTGMSDSINGVIYLTKRSHIYKAIRTGQRDRAYEVVVVSKQRGALEGSLVEGVDQAGNACLYGLDPNIGPWRVGQDGLKTCGQDIQTTWKRTNLDATQVVCCGLYYPDSQQVRWWISVDGGNTPSLEIILQTDKCRESEDGIRRGWATATGPSATALCACLFASNINDNTARNLILRPVVGLTGAAASILRLDTGTDDAGTAYYAKVKTKPYSFAGILNKFGIMAASVLAKAASGVTLYVRAIRDFGLETLDRSTTLTAASSETHVVKPLDSLSFSELSTVQLQFGDDPAESSASAGTWEVNAIAIKPRPEQTA